MGADMTRGTVAGSDPGSAFAREWGERPPVLLGTDSGKNRSLARHPRPTWPTLCPFTLDSCSGLEIIGMRKFSTLTDPIVSVHHPRVLVETAVSQGAAIDDLLEGTDLTAEMLASPDVRMSYLQYGRLIHNAKRLVSNPALGLDAGKNIGLAQMGVLGLALMNSATVGAALDVFLRYHRAVAPAWDFEVRRAGDDVVVDVREAFNLAPHSEFAIEMLLGALYVQGKALYGAVPPVREIRVPYPKPEHYDRYEALSDIPMKFDAGVTQVVFDASMLDHKVAFADPATAKLAEEYCLREHPPTAEKDGVVAQVRRLLATRQGPPPQLEDVAKILQTSTRTLRRALHGMGTSFNELVNDSRRERAEEWVRATQLPLDQIATRLGFSDVRSFRRAFKRWTGKTPTELRSK